MINKGEKRFRYNLFQCNIKGLFDIFNDISDHVTSIQLRDTASNVNHDVSTTLFWMYDSNFKRDLPLIWEHLDTICSTSKDEKVCMLNLKAYFTLSGIKIYWQIQKKTFVKEWFLFLWKKKNIYIRIYFDNILPSRMRIIMILYQKTSFTLKITYDIDIFLHFDV